MSNSKQVVMLVGNAGATVNDVVQLLLEQRGIEVLRVTNDEFKQAQSITEGILGVLQVEETGVDAADKPQPEQGSDDFGEQMRQINEEFILHRDLVDERYAEDIADGSMSMNNILKSYLKYIEEQGCDPEPIKDVLNGIAKASIVRKLDELRKCPMSTEVYAKIGRLEHHLQSVLTKA